MTFSYTGRDYAAIRQQMIEVIQDRVPGWAASQNDFGTVLVDALSFMGDMFSYYLDRNALELNVLTANQPANVMALADLYGYAPDLAQSATTTLELRDTGVNTPDTGIVVPRLTRFRTAAGMVFESQSEVALAKGGTATVEAWQGTTVTVALGTSSGNGSQTYTITGSDMDARLIEVDVVSTTGAATWTYVERLIDAGPTDTVFSVRPDLDNHVRVVFGDGFSGAIPAEGASLTLRYRSCLGDVNTDVDTINYLDVSWSSGVSLAGVTVRNTTIARGGTNPESLDSIRKNAAAALRTQRRAVTPKDYADQARTIAGVSDAQIVPRLWSRPVVRILPRALTDLLDVQRAGALEDAVARHLNNVCLAGVSPTVVVATHQTFYVKIDLNLYANASCNRVWDEAYQCLISRFSYANAAFDRPISTSEILVALSHDVAGIRFAAVTWLSTDLNSATTHDVLLPNDGEVFSISFIADGDEATLNLIGGIDDRSAS